MPSYQDLRADQTAAIDFITGGEDSLLCGDVGCGKTVIALTAAKLALARGDVNRWLVLAPLLVATDTWQSEASEWDHLDAHDIAIACGTEGQRVAAIRSDARIVVINYENLSWLLAQYPRVGKADPLPFDGLICDEIDKLKSVSSNRFKDFRNRIKKFRKRIGMTGTLIPNDLTELWGQVYMVDGGESFGKSFYKWRSQYFYPIDYKQYDWMPHRDSKQYFIDKIADMTLRLTATGLPKVIAREPAKLVLPPETRDRYDELEREYFITVQDLHGVNRHIDAANAAVLTGKLQQICAGFSYVEKMTTIGDRTGMRAVETKEAVWHSYDRFEWLLKLCAQVPEQILVFYHFNEELDELKRRFPNLPHLGKGVSNKQARSNIAHWNAGDLDMLALHPASAGHGLNLQKSGAHHIAFLTLPWSGGMYKQVIGRLCRTGQKAKQIYVHTALFENTIDWDVFNTVTGKLTGMESFLDDLETACAFRKAS